MGDLVIADILQLYKGKRVLITGDTGFKGSWLALWLYLLGADVVGYALPPLTQNDHFNLLGLNNLIHHIDGDIRDSEQVAQVFNKFQPEFLFHLAAQSLVRLSYNEPKQTFDTNVGGSVNILEMIRTSNSLKAAIYVTSDKCYKNKEWLWGYRENDELGGRDPYSASKGAAEIVFAAYLASFFAKQTNYGVASVRAGNVIGGGDWALDRIVPDCVKALQEKQPIVIRNPNATRPWQHVLEPLFGYLLLAARLYKAPQQFSSSWNFGPGTSSIRTVQDLAARIIECWGSGKLQLAVNNDGLHEANLLHLNCDKAQQLLQWHSKWDFAETIAATVAWYKNIYSGTSALTMSSKQINEYMEEST
jgi:CDP-glucose 4,6-dehydratase